MRTVAIVFLGLLAAAPVAWAKGRETEAPPQLHAPDRGALVCGAPGCLRVPGADALPAAGPIGLEAPVPAPYFTLSFEREDLAGHAEAYVYVYVPSADAIAGNRDRPGALAWYPAFGPAKEAARAAVAGLRPFPPPPAWPAELKSPGRAPAGAAAAPATRTGAAAVGAGLSAVLLMLAAGGRGRSCRPGRAV